MVGAIDVVDRSLSLVPVMNFCDGDQLDGLALRKQKAKHRVTQVTDLFMKQQSASQGLRDVQSWVHRMSGADHLDGSPAALLCWSYF